MDPSDDEAALFSRFTETADSLPDAAPEPSATGIDLAAILDRDQPIPGTPAPKWGYDPAVRAGYLKMTDAEYNAFPAIRSSLLKCATLSEMYSLLTAPQQDTDALADGTLADLAILGEIGQVFDRFKVVDVPINPKTGEAYGRTSKKAEASYAAAKALHPDAFLVSADELAEHRATLTEVVTAFNKYRFCRAALKDCMLKVSGVMYHPEWKAWLKWQPDALPTKPDGDAGWAIRDLKTSRRHISKFRSDFFEWGYDNQAIYYSYCHEECLKLLGLELTISNFDFLVVSKSEDGRSPRKAMARVLRIPVSKMTGNLMVKNARDRLFPEDGMGRAPMFIAALRTHLNVNPDPSDEAAIDEIWPGYENDPEPPVLCDLPQQRPNFA